MLQLRNKFTDENDKYKLIYNNIMKIVQYSYNIL